jgi:hypothetical protein
MLTSANVTVKMAAHYYANHDNYYTVGETLSPPLWQGNLAKELGLLENFTPENFGVPLTSQAEDPLKEKPTLSKEEKASVLEEALRLFESVENEDTRKRLEKNLSKCLEKGPLTPKGIAQTVGKFGRELENQGEMPGVEVSGKRDEMRLLLERVAAKKERRAGLDLTFSAPKSVSIQALVFGDKRLIEAHREAVKTTLEYLEKHFANTREGSKVHRKTVTTGNMAIAQFEHDLSREKDPHLHTHNVVINMTLQDGKMKALHNDVLYQHKKMLGTLYRNELALRVRNLGYDITPGAEGTGLPKKRFFGPEFEGRLLELASALNVTFL